MNTKTITYDIALWKLVPKKIDAKMIQAFYNATAHFSGAPPAAWQLWDAMLAAAPSAPEQPPIELMPDVIEMGLDVTKSGATVVIMQRNNDNTRTVIYNGIHPIGGTVARALLVSHSAAPEQPAEQDAPDLFKQMGLPDAKFPGLCGAGKATQTAAPPLCDVQPSALIDLLTVEKEAMNGTSSFERQSAIRAIFARGREALKASFMQPVSPVAAVDNDSARDAALEEAAIFSESQNSHGEFIAEGLCAMKSINQGAVPESSESREELRERLHRKGMAIGDAPCNIGPAPIASIDSQEFQRLLETWWHAEESVDILQAKNALIEHIDAWHAAGIAAAIAAQREGA